jgi:hypothetical protein
MRFMAGSGARCFDITCSVVGPENKREELVSRTAIEITRLLRDGVYLDLQEVRVVDSRDR